MRARCEPKNKAKKCKKGIPKKPQHVFFHVFAQTTHVVAASHGYACVGKPATQLYPSYIEIRSGVSEPQDVKIWTFPLLCLVDFTTACTTVQVVTSREFYPRIQRTKSSHIIFSQRFVISVNASLCAQSLRTTF